MVPSPARAAQRSSPAGKKQLELYKGDKVEACGVYAEPLAGKTATGLTLYKIILDAELINEACCNNKVTDVQLYLPDENV